MQENMFDAAYWDDQYLHYKPGWDIGSPSTPLKEYIDQLTDKNTRILIPGCGNGYEAEYLLQQGFQHVTVIDLSPVLTKSFTEKLQSYAGKQLTVITGDFFDHTGQYDLILEQTFFCVFPPQYREKYVQHVQELLAPGGIIAGVLFNREFDSAPPFGGKMESYIPVFQKYLDLMKMEPCYNSIKPRQGAEVFFIARKN
ncbi:methyltransferase domain-containing protein [Pseudobacter ginsenosidimutans]|uniref:SAM-dependent methyltransferase n=1 Tax=Pseudobacter ginsenosidimutans TaxID=661488 RepID=A0A4Q7MF80_9BACT|nr:methyltransferase domain-containing protein [Pseudobacter ginsenosidimutans]RZS66905.1 SAM-dependent methyltransferase [Pseudobacter ginsenosidimutans]